MSDVWEVGARFYSWTLKEKLKGTHWLCVCECGTERTLREDKLRNGSSRSCGCKLYPRRKKPKPFKKPEKYE